MKKSALNMTSPVIWIVFLADRASIASTSWKTWARMNLQKREGEGELGPRPCPSRLGSTPSPQVSVLPLQPDRKAVDSPPYTAIWVPGATYRPR